MCMCVCVRVCVYVCERERQREREKKRERDSAMFLCLQISNEKLISFTERLEYFGMCVKILRINS
jgi:hypothetical protein